jgi:hypothetical protein
MRVRASNELGFTQPSPAHGLLFLWNISMGRAGLGRISIKNTKNSIDLACFLIHFEKDMARKGPKSVTPLDPTFDGLA